MNEKNQKILMWALIGSAILVVSGAIIIRSRKKTKGKSKFQKKLVEITNREWRLWNKGKEEEDSPSMYERLKEYWRNIGWGENRWSPKGVAWSSAFISYVMKKAGAGNKFNYSSSHSRYIREARKNREQNNSNPFKAFRLNEKKAEVGDLVCYYRGTTSSDPFDRDSSYQSHCDVVVSTSKDNIEVIGGNVDNSVRKKIVPLDSKGYVKKDGAGKKWFAVIKTR